MKIEWRELQASRLGYYRLMSGLVLIILLGLGSVLYTEHHGHIVTGMNNQFVWGLPDVFSMFLMLAAAGALSMALLASVFGRSEFKPLAPLSGVLAIALLIAGLTLLMLDLGRPDRVIVAMLNFNPKSVLAWNLMLYSGFVAFVALYVWTLLEHRMNRYTPWAISLAFIWRIALTTGTGSIYGFQVSRQAFDSALLAPMFIALSLSYGLAVFNMVLLLAWQRQDGPIGEATLARLARLQVIFIGIGLYFVLVYHLTNLYFTKHYDFEYFILMQGGVYSILFWLGVVLLGSILPVLLLLSPSIGPMRQRITASAGLVILGAFAQLYVTIIGGQAFPLVLFPGHQVRSSFYDGVVNSYTPSLPEWLLGFAGLAMVGLIVMIALKVIGFLPDRLDDAALEVNPAQPAAATS